MNHRNTDIIAQCRGLPGGKVWGRGGLEKIGCAGLGGEAVGLGCQEGGFY